MATLADALLIQPNQSADRRFKVVYRDSAGTIHFEVPFEHIGAALADTEGTLWVDVHDPPGLANESVDTLFRAVFRFHPLAIEDALTDSHVPKVDDWSDYLFIVFPTIEFDEETHDLCLQELDMFVGKNYVVTYHRVPMPVLSQLRASIERDPASRLRHGSASLLYHILDNIVADYLPAIEHLDDAIDAAQDEVFGKPTTRTLQRIFRVKRSALRLHRTLSPQREVLNRLARDDYEPIEADERVYFRDVYDQIVRIHDISESLRDLIAGALDTYLSAISNRTNDIMKALTLVTVMFLPISFVTSFFGMNFFSENLAVNAKLPAGLLFWGSCLIMVLTPLGMWIWAKRRGWF
jgi:magnesium transporter